MIHILLLLLCYIVRLLRILLFPSRVCFHLLLPCVLSMCRAAE